MVSGSSLNSQKDNRTKVIKLPVPYVRNSCQKRARSRIRKKFIPDPDSGDKIAPDSGSGTLIIAFYALRGGKEVMLVSNSKISRYLEQ
jgi:hypothetical protein